MDSSDISVLTMIMGYLMGTNIFGPVAAVQREYHSLKL